MRIFSATILFLGGGTKKDNLRIDRQGYLEYINCEETPQGLKKIK